MHPGAEEEVEIREMEDGLNPQRDFDQRGLELDIPPPPQSEGIHVEATFDHLEQRMDRIESRQASQHDEMMAYLRSVFPPPPPQP